jgi:hypothetical protein
MPSRADCRSPTASASNPSPRLVDASIGTGAAVLDFTTDPADIGPGLSAALDVLQEPALTDAADAAWMPSYDGPHAPVKPAERISTHHQSPLLAAIQLTGARDQLSPA